MPLTMRDERGYNQLFRPVGSSRYRAQRRHEWFIARARGRNARRILEIGCGTGEASAAMARATGVEVVGVDVSATFLQQARATHMASNLRFETLDVVSDDLARLGTFDFIFGNGILHHLIPRLNRVLRVLHELSSDDGGVAFIEPNLMHPACAFMFGTTIGRRVARLEPEEMAFRPGELRDALSQAGWCRVAVNARDFLLPGLPVPLIKPILMLESLCEPTWLAKWLAQSLFVTADRHDGVSASGIVRKPQSVS